MVTIRLPTLLEPRVSSTFIEHFIKQFAKQHDKQIKGVSSAARRLSWPTTGPATSGSCGMSSNMIVVDYDELLDCDDLPTSLPNRPLRPRRRRAIRSPRLVGKPLQEIERLFIAETLRVTDGNREEAANMLGIGERTLYRKIKEYQL